MVHHLVASNLVLFFKCFPMFLHKKQQRFLVPRVVLGPLQILGLVLQWGEWGPGIGCARVVLGPYFGVVILGCHLLSTKVN